MTEDSNLGAKDDDLAGRESRLAAREVLDGNTFGDRVEAVDGRSAEYCAVKHQ